MQRYIAIYSPDAPNATLYIPQMHPMQRWIFPRRTQCNAVYSPDAPNATLYIPQTHQMQSYIPIHLDPIGNINKFTSNISNIITQNAFTVTIILLYINVILV